MLNVTKGNLVSQLCNDVELPEMIRVRQKFDPSHIEKDQIVAVVRKELEQEKFDQVIRPGMRIAITSGSRGVANVALITKAIVDFVKEKGGEPFVFPAMGSHGGATAEGQKEILESYGVSESFLGCPILSSMDTVQVGNRPSDGKPVFVDRYAAEADGIILCGRIKAHTAFRGPYESGLLKMSVIGMGKQHGAEQVHESGFDHMAKLLPEVSRVIFDHTNILMGVGTIENAFDQTCRIKALLPDEIWEQEPELLKEAKSRMGQIYFNDIDLLVVDRIGKDISGDGMDPNVTGRFACPRTASGGISTQRIVVLGLTKATHHNANGIGMADITTRRILDETNLDATYPNAVTSTVLEVVKIPFITENDQTAIRLGIRTCNEIDKSNPRIVRIRDTMHVEEIEISKALLPEAEGNPNIEILGGPYRWEFDEDGNLW
ncbi:MAG: DUF2088 domain-containing protein [Lachnospiraceae bacterium]|uniref:DUF2088 domain-containing protein n=2 Tax=Lachnospiraceae TaxID=186803 RepID=A0A9D2PT50_9FIRM|nr:DUF2088 domain-containing protein [Lachnospiraceae bacterium]HIR05607.1 DUF2088 domain-containing protein [Candidatus Copromonas faecavium]HJC65271.1 DUF2088 domain-containing protein [Candidatus Enterocloster excrementigallinarum]